MPAAALALALALAGCGSDDTTGSAMGTHDMGSMSSSTPRPSGSVGTPATGAHNDADVTFATGMIPHHDQAVTMAGMAARMATNADVKKLAAGIGKAQAPEVTRMSGWLAGWGKPVPGTTSSMGGTAMGDGMMSDADMAELNHATGAGFDRLWLQLMIEHHQGAVTMARAELADGTNVEAKSLARSIITSQTGEISQMRKLEPTIG